MCGVDWDRVNVKEPSGWKGEKLSEMNLCTVRVANFSWSLNR